MIWTESKKNMDCNNDEYIKEQALDLSLPLEERLDAFRTMHTINIDDTLSIIKGMLKFGATSIITEYAYELCKSSHINTMQKLEIAMTMATYMDPITGKDDIRVIQKGNDALGYILEHEYMNLYILITIDTIMRIISDANEVNRDVSKTLLKRIVADEISYSSNRRYDIIRRLMNIAISNMKTCLAYYGVESKKLNTYREVRRLFINNVPEHLHLEVITHNSLIINLCIIFVESYHYEELNMNAIFALTFAYINSSEEAVHFIEILLIEISENPALSENIRTSAADVILNNATSLYTRERAQDIINVIAEENRIANNRRRQHENGINNKTIYNFSQNVHKQSVSSSVEQALDFLSTMDNIAASENIFSDIESTKEYISLDEEYKYKIAKAFRHILSDSCVYSKHNFSMLDIFCKLWRYIETHEYRDELIKRMFEELYDMSNMCNTGYISRLVNIMSGFGDFSITISWEEQITSVFVQRFNKYIMNISEPGGIPHEDYVNHIVPLFDNVDNILEEFKSRVLEEMTLSKCAKRVCYDIFCNIYIPVIEFELRKEYKSYISQKDFNRYMAAAKAQYNI